MWTPPAALKSVLFWTINLFSSIKLSTGSSTGAIARGCNSSVFSLMCSRRLWVKNVRNEARCECGHWAVPRGRERISLFEDNTPGLTLLWSHKHVSPLHWGFYAVMRAVFVSVMMCLTVSPVCSNDVLSINGVTVFLCRLLRTVQQELNSICAILHYLLKENYIFG